MPSNIYDIGTIPQIRGNIDVGIAASSVPFDPIKLDPNLYKSVMDMQLQQQKMLIDKEELQYKRDVLDNNAEQFWQEQNSTAAATLLGYNNDYVSKAKNGVIDTPGASMPYFDKQFKPYRDKLIEVQSKYVRGQQNKEIQKLLLEKMSNPEYRKSVEAGMYWSNTLTKINDIAAGKTKNYTTKNIDWNKFNAVSKNLADENIPVNPDDLMINNFIIEDKDKIIEEVAKAHTILKPQSEIIPKDGKDYIVKSEVGLSPYDMYNNIYNELLSNERLVGQLKSDYGYSLKDEQILEGGYDSREDMIGGLVQSHLSYEAMMAVNRGLGLSVANPGEFSKDQYKRVISTASAGTTIEEQKNLKELDADNKLKIEEQKAANDMEREREKSKLRKEEEQKKQEGRVDLAKTKDKLKDNGGSSEKYKSAKGRAGLTPFQIQKREEQMDVLDGFLKDRYPDQEFDIDYDLGGAIEKLGGLSRISEIKQDNEKIRIRAISSSGKSSTELTVYRKTPLKSKFKDERNNAGYTKDSEYEKFEPAKAKTTQPKPGKSGGFRASTDKKLKKNK